MQFPLPQLLLIMMERLLWNSTAEFITHLPRSRFLGSSLDLRPLFGGRELPVPALLLLQHSPDEIESKFNGKIRKTPDLPNCVEAYGVIFTGDGEERYVHVMAARITDDTGNTVGVVQCAEDITGEQKLRRNIFQIQKMEAIGRLVSGIAHDLNNALTVILGGCDLLSFSLKDEESAMKYLQEIRMAVHRAEKIVGQLLSYSKRQHFIPCTVDINEIVQTAVNKIAGIMDDEVILKTELASEPIFTRVDPFQLEQSIINLLVNAREAISNKGEIRITTSSIRLNTAWITSHFFVPPGIYALITVSDTGSGIEDNTLRHIFEPYFTTKQGGSGLGLATVYGFVHQSGGHITVDSTVGKGTTLSIFLPFVSMKKTMQKIDSDMEWGSWSNTCGR